MGLDLILEKADRTQVNKMDADWHELAYGRKTWGIANYLAFRCQAIERDWLYKVTPEAWDAFMAYFEDWDIPRIKEILDEMDSDPSTFDPDNFLYLEEFVDGMGRGHLGVEWDANVMIRWYEADPEVRKAFENDDYVRLMLSY